MIVPSTALSVAYWMAKREGRDGVQPSRHGYGNSYTALECVVTRLVLQLTPVFVKENGMNTSHKTNKNSALHRLAAFPGSPDVYPGHGPSTTLDSERRDNPYLSL